MVGIWSQLRLGVMPDLESHLWKACCEVRQTKFYNHLNMENSYET